MANGNIPLWEAQGMRDMSVRGGNKVVSDDYNLGTFRYASQAAQNITGIVAQQGQMLINAGKFVSNFGFSKQNIAKQSAAFTDPFGKKAAAEQQSLNSGSKEFELQYLEGSSAIERKFNEDCSAGKYNHIQSREQFDAEVAPELDKGYASLDASLEKNEYIQSYYKNAGSRANELSTRNREYSRRVHSAAIFNMRERLVNANFETQLNNDTDIFQKHCQNGDWGAATVALQKCVDDGMAANVADKLMRGMVDSALQQAAAQSIAESGGDNQLALEKMARYASDIRNAIGYVKLKNGVEIGITPDMIDIGKLDEIMSGRNLAKVREAVAKDKAASAPKEVTNEQVVDSITKAGAVNNDLATFDYKGMTAGDRQDRVNAIRSEREAAIDVAANEQKMKMTAHYEFQKQQLFERDAAERKAAEEYCRKHNLPPERLKAMYEDIDKQTAKFSDELSSRHKSNHAVVDGLASQEKLKVASKLAKLDAQLNKESRQVKLGLVATIQNEDEFQEAIQTVIDAESTGKSTDDVLNYIKAGTQNVADADTSAIILAHLLNNMKEYSEANDPAGDKIFQAANIMRQYCTEEDRQKGLRMLMLMEKMSPADKSLYNECHAMLMGALKSVDKDWFDKKGKLSMANVKEKHRECFMVITNAMENICDAVTRNPDNAKAMTQKVCDEVAAKAHHHDVREITERYLKKYEVARGNAKVDGKWWTVKRDAENAKTKASSDVKENKIDAKDIADRTNSNAKDNRGDDAVRKEFERAVNEGKQKKD